MARRYKVKPNQIEEWVARHFPGYKKQGKGRQLTINNPFNADTGHNLWICTEETTTKSHKERNFYVHDWRSREYNMTFLTFVKRYLKVSFFEALRDVTGKDKNSLRSSLMTTRMKQSDEVDDEPEVLKEITLPNFATTFDKSDTIAGRTALQYLQSRMITKELAIQYRLMYTPDTIVFPYIEYGTLVYWQERSFLEKKFNFPDERSTGLSKTDYLYNFDNIEQPRGCVILVESLINCINIGEGCGATGGASMSPDGKQIRKIQALEPRLIVFAPDNDDAGLKSIFDNYMMMRKVIMCSYAYSLPPAGLDWNELEKRDGAGSARDYVLKHTFSLNISQALKLREQAS